MHYKTKILLFGASGMAGHMIYYFLKETGKYDILNVVFRDKITEDSIILDVTNNEDVVEIVKKTKPDIIINCIGILIKESKENPHNAIFLNAYFPHLLKHLSDEISAKLIHISTDCVFTGKSGNYSENDFQDADDIYGRSKALGEIINNKDLTLRTSIIGPEIKKNGEGLFHWFMNQKGEIKGYLYAIWSGVTTLELAKAIDKSIDNDLIGLLHLSNGNRINKYDLLCLFKNIFSKLDVSVIADKNVIVDKSIKKSGVFDFDVPSYEIMILELREWMNRHNDLYLSYSL